MKFCRRRQFLRLVAGVATLPAVSRFARAQSYPTRPVRMIVPLSAGSASDILARQLATKMSESWGQPVVVENRPGAGTTTGTDAVAKAAPDGHTLLINSAAFAASAAIYSKLPYDPIKDFISDQPGCDCANRRCGGSLARPTVDQGPCRTWPE